LVDVGDGYVTTARRAPQLVPGRRNDRHPDFVTLAKRRRPDLVGIVMVD